MVGPCVWLCLSTPQSSCPERDTRTRAWPRTSATPHCTASRSLAPKTTLISSHHQRRSTFPTSLLLWWKMTWRDYLGAQEPQSRPSSSFRKTARWRWSRWAQWRRRSSAWSSSTTTTLERTTTYECPSPSPPSECLPPSTSPSECCFLLVIFRPVHCLMENVALSTFIPIHWGLGITSDQSTSTRPKETKVSFKEKKLAECICFYSMFAFCSQHHYGLFTC